jgi:hypothetical protein
MDPLPDEADVRVLSDAELEELVNNAGIRVETGDAQAELHGLRGAYHACFHGKSDCDVIRPSLLKKINGWKAYQERQARRAGGARFLQVSFIS